jgi:UDP-N-acetylglucosamine 2-epimerase (non-hydrolysing)
VHFACGGGSQAVQTGRIMEAYESHLARDRPDAVVVVGDVNSTLACTIVAKKAGVPVAHVEAGLRSGDMTMPEEINRIVTDSIADWFFVTEPAGAENLRREGHAENRVFDVGHVMADNVIHQAHKLASSDRSSYATEAIKQQIGARYGAVTLHRPANVDHPERLAALVGVLNRISEVLPLVFAVHPRTQAHLTRHAVRVAPSLHLMPPQPYMSFLNLWKDATLVLTDSGGLQEETTALGVPCLTLRDNTERPITVSEGSNTLAGTEPARIERLALELLERGSRGEGRRGQRPALWDGHAAERIVNILAEQLT